jgi:hypothetical protein
LPPHLLMQGLIFKKVFANQFYNPSDSVVVRKPIWNYRLPVRSSPGTQPHN